MKLRSLGFVRRPSSAGGNPEQPSMRSRMGLLIGDRRKPIVVLVMTAIVSAMAEAATLALVAQVAAALVKAPGSKTRLSLLDIHAPTGTLIIAAFVIVSFRLVLQLSMSILPARIVADVEARLRTDLFHSFSHASWDVQSRDREGQLQENMTSQAAQATQGVTNMLSLLTSTFTYVVLLTSAFALNLFAAGIVLVVAFGMYALLRPLRGVGMRRARALSQAQVSYAAGIAESIRGAEETQASRPGPVPV